MAERCDYCKRKSYMVLKCKCEKLYCIIHRNAEDHQCGFDYKKEGKDFLEKQNPVIKTAKLTVL